MLALLVVAGALAAGRAPRLLWRMAGVAIATAIAAAALWIASYPGLPGATIDRGMVLYASGVVVAIAGLVLSRRAIKA
jgi:hypothetical protein